MRKSIYTLDQIDALLSGKGVVFAGQFASVNDIAAPVEGGQYLIGTEKPYDVYIYISGLWVNAGPFQGEKGEKGDPGNSIKSIDRTSGNGAPGSMDTYTITLTDGSTTAFQIYNGMDGNGAGDMTARVYDPTNKQRDVFAYADEIGKEAANKANKPSYNVAVMSASAWSGNTYSFEETYPTATCDVSIEVAPTATAEQFEAFGGAMICGSADSNIATALGDVPTVDIPIIVKVVSK